MINKRSKYTADYERRNITRIVLKLNTLSDSDVIRRIRDHSNMTDYIRQLVRSEKG